MTKKEIETGFIKIMNEMKIDSPTVGREILFENQFGDLAERLANFIASNFYVSGEFCSHPSAEEVTDQDGHHYCGRCHYHFE